MKYNYLNIIKKSNVQNKNGAWLWICLCDCGNQIVVRPCDVRSGHTKSCECHNIMTLVKNHTTHGKRFTKEYKTWCGIKARCYNPKEKSFSDYGGRGIKVCNDWIDNFSKFYADMGNCPDGFSIERKNNNLGYSKDNCIWADKKVQSRNRRSSVFVLLYKERLVLRDAEIKLGIYRGSLYQHAHDFNKTHQEACDHFAKRKALKNLSKSKNMIKNYLGKIAA